jgi:sugar phosphate isomerase/epimerase
VIIMIEIGTSTHAIAGFGKPTKPFRQALAEMADCGYAHFLLLASEAGPPLDRAGDAPSALIDVRRSDLETLLRTVSGYGLRVSAVYPGFSPDYSPAGMAGTIKGLRAYREIARRLGSHIMVHPAGRAEKPRMPHDQKKEMIARVAEVMDAVASDIPGELFKMAVDIHFQGIIETVADCEYLLAVAKKRNTGLCLNIGHMTTLGQEGWLLLERHADRINVIAWKDHLIGENLPEPVTSVELGRGRSSLARYVEAYRTVQCPAVHYITFEHVPFEEKKDALKRSFDYLQRLFQQ